MVDKSAFELPANFHIETVSVEKNFTLLHLKHIHRIENVKFIGGMTEEEYRALINEIWIGVILTLIIVSFVICLCSCFVYHKFEMWKLNYDARARMRSLNNDTRNMDLEALPNYTLVSGLPTYDDALEQLRLNSSNHLLINHQTLMKIFGGTTTLEKSEKSRLDSPVPSYEDAICAPDLEPEPSKNCIYSSQKDFENNSGVPQNTNVILRSNSVDDHRPPVHHRFKCTIVPQQIGIDSTILFNSHNVNELQTSSLHQQEQKTNQFSIGNNNSLGSLNIVKEIKKSKPEVPWIHGSATSLCLDYNDSASKYLSKNEHRTSLY